MPSAIPWLTLVGTQLIILQPYHHKAGTVFNRKGFYNPAADDLAPIHLVPRQGFPSWLNQFPSTPE